MADIDYTPLFTELNNNLLSLNTTASGLNETLNSIQNTSYQMAFISEMLLYMVASLFVAYFVTMMLKITFSR